MASDVCRALHLATNNVTNHTGKLEPREKRNVARSIINPLHGGRPMVTVSESGLYKLIMRSDKAEAVVFQNWVTQEVLPAIRKTGKYALTDHGREAMPLPMDIAEAVVFQNWPLSLPYPRAILGDTPQEPSEAPQRPEMALAHRG